jgi:hypothetical protein
MTPTPKLRWVERFQPVIGTNYGETLRVLQQWWDFETFAGEGEWRDVPLEAEQ